MGTTDHEIRVPVTLKQRVFEARWKLKTSSSALLREVFTEYAKGKPAKNRREPTSTFLRFSIDDEVWAKAQARAEAEGRPLAEVGREGLEAKLSNIGGQPAG